VLVAGGTGFVGTPIVRRLREEGVEVVVATRSTGLDLAGPGLPAIDGPLDAVVHVAVAPVGWAAPAFPADAYSDHRQVTRHALEIARRKGARVLLASTWVYGTQAPVPASELDPPQPHTPYATSRLDAERVAAVFHRDHGVAVDVLRVFNAYGPRQPASFVIPRTIAGALDGRVVLEAPAPRRDYVHVDDVARAFALAARRRTGGFEVFNIGSGVSRAVDEVARTVARLAGRPVDIRYTGAVRGFEIVDARADIAKAASVLDWRPAIGFDEGLAALVDAARRQRA
jgi:nucleoside-diphosphate-sugar epimerase